jgi:hypothetical protein
MHQTDDAETWSTVEYLDAANGTSLHRYNFGSNCHVEGTLRLNGMTCLVATDDDIQLFLPNQPPQHVNFLIGKGDYRCVAISEDLVQLEDDFSISLMSISQQKAVEIKCNPILITDKFVVTSQSTKVSIFKHNCGDVDPEPILSVVVDNNVETVTCIHPFLQDYIVITDTHSKSTIFDIQTGQQVTSTCKPVFFQDDLGPKSAAKM